MLMEMTRQYFRLNLTVAWPVTQQAWHCRWSDVVVAVVVQTAECAPRSPSSE